MAASPMLFLVVFLMGLAVHLTKAQLSPEATLPGTATTITGIYTPYEEQEYLIVSIRIEAFLGIPFAEPPIGDLRFKNPVKKGDLGNNYTADHDRSVCPQAGGSGEEDCLYLSVHTASPRPTNAPVMVWIHGGAYTGGSGSSSSYEPFPLIALAPDMVVVNINYRLGVLGFLTTGDISSPGNYGMFDQIMALQWVQANIEAFGGDPSKVTIMGESAGAASVGLQLVSPLSVGLFSQAIMQSGNALCPWAVDTDINRQIGITTELAGRVNCTTTDNEALVECLRGVEADELVRAQARLTAKYLITELLFVPVVDNAFLPDLPIELIKRGEYQSVPTLLGTNEDEGTLIALRAYPSYLVRQDPPIMTLEEFRGFLPDYLYYNTPLLVSAVEQWYVDWTQADDPSANHLEAFIKVNTDQVFACATEAMARALEGTGTPVYRYEMTHDASRSIFGPTTGWMGAGHGEDVQFVFAWGLNGGVQTDEEKYMSVHFMRYWSNFIKTGDPNTPLSTSEYPSWPRYNIPEQEYKILSLTMNNSRAMRMDSCAFWLNYAPELYKYENNDPEDLYNEWKQDYEEWKDVHMTEWTEVFDEYKENSGCEAP